ncbi:MAG: formate/nitrite transporter family protein [Candidatus Coatesbacteria bacterium]|nr:formate/nitrite transporter family protein [Candidatus Coatesbacteria bacterium]
MPGFNSPQEVANALLGVCETKSRLHLGRMVCLGILAGAYIGFGAHLATTIGTGIGILGLKKLAMGAVFSVGLMLVVIAGAELFTGNCLLACGLTHGRVKLRGVFRNLSVVYITNLFGSICLAWIIASQSGLLDGAVGGTAIQIAYGKIASVEQGLDHNWAYFFRAIGCNWLVCLAIYMALAARSIEGKVWAIFFPIMAFVSSGFEHCIANMYFIPAGILAKRFTAAVAASGLSPDQLNMINWGSMWSQNLISVTLGNIVGGSIFVGVGYWYVFVKGNKS